MAKMTWEERTVVAVESTADRLDRLIAEQVKTNALLASVRSELRLAAKERR